MENPPIFELDDIPFENYAIFYPGIEPSDALRLMHPL
jgi:hypothetical protein